MTHRSQGRDRCYWRVFFNRSISGGGRLVTNGWRHHAASARSSSRAGHDETRHKAGEKECRLACAYDYINGTRACSRNWEQYSAPV